MKYLVTLKPLEPFMFGGDQTFGTLGDKDAGSYFIKSRPFPQQTALLGMLKKEMMTQAGLLTRKRRGEWVDKQKKAQASKLVGNEKFNMLEEKKQDFGAIKSLSPLFLLSKGKRYIKKVNIDAYPYEEGVLKGFNAKIDIYDNFVSLDENKSLQMKTVFRTVEQTGNKKGGEENSLFRKVSYMLNEGFSFAFYAELDVELNDALVTLGADRSSFMMHVQKDDATLNYLDKQGHMTLLSDAYISVNIKENCVFAITSELSHRNLKGKKTATQKYKTVFGKSETLYLYEKGSVFIEPNQTLLDNINNNNLQQIGYNHYTLGEKK